MLLHQRVGIVFIAFNFLLLVWNTFTPDNPDHVLNMIEQSATLALFVVVYFAPTKMGQALQVVTLGVIAFVPMSLSDSPFWGAVVAVIALDLIFAYGGYQTRATWKFIATNAALFGLCILALANFEPLNPVMLLRAGVWTLFINVFCWIQWAIDDDRIKAFFAKAASELIIQNRMVLDQNRELIREIEDLRKGCNDADAG